MATTNKLVLLLIDDEGHTSKDVYRVPAATVDPGSAPVTNFLAKYTLVSTARVYGVYIERAGTPTGTATANDWDALDKAKFIFTDADGRPYPVNVPAPTTGAGGDGKTLFINNEIMDMTAQLATDFETTAIALLTNASGVALSDLTRGYRSRRNRKHHGA
jgi:hypothetical protein